MTFYFLAAIIMAATFILLISGLKASEASHKFLMIFFSLSFLLLGAFLWLFSGVATRYTHPYQSAQTAKIQVSETAKQLRFYPLIQDGRPKVEKPQNTPLASKPASSNGGKHDSNKEMLAMAQNLENKLRSGETDAESWAMLARTYIFIGEKDKAAEALIEGFKAFDAASEMHEKFKQETKKFLESGYDGEYASQLKGFLGNE